MAEKLHIYDDVASFWWFTVMWAMWLIPITIQRIRLYFKSKDHKTKRTIESIPDYLPQNKLNTSFQWLSLENIFFAFSWILLLFLLIQLPQFQNGKISSFDPEEILGINHGADDIEIKKAKRKLAIIYHPDKCQPPLTKRKCHDMFILIHKAAEVLLDEKARQEWKNNQWDKTAFIALPTWFLDHPQITLIVYILFFVILGIVVHFWWKSSNLYHKSGVKKRTIATFWKLVRPNMSMRQLLEILCASDEFRIVDINIDDHHHDFIKLEQEIMKLQKSRNMSQNVMIMFKDIPYIRKSTVLLTAHLLGLDIPSSLYDQYLFILSKIPKILSIMIDITILRERYWLQTLQLIRLKQALIQGVWPNESVFKQLPHWTPIIDKGIRKKGYKDILSLCQLDDNSLKSTLGSVYNTKQDIDLSADKAMNMIRMYPFVNVKYCARTYGEKRIFKEDIVTVSVHLDRLCQPWKFGVFDAEKVTKSTRNKPKIGQKHKRNQTGDIRIINKMKAPELKGIDDDKSKDEDYACFDTKHDEFVSEARKLKLGTTNGPIVHSLGFPFRCYEKWLIVLIDKETGFVIDYKAISDMNGLNKIDLHFRANKEKTKRYSYLLMVTCDSYLGVDKQIEFKLYIDCDSHRVNDNNNNNNNNNAQHDIRDNPEGLVEDNPVEEDVEDRNVKWYYLWNETFWEFLLTLFLLYFIYLMLITSSFGKKYIDPYVEQIWSYFYEKLSVFIAPIMQTISNVLLKEFGFNLVRWWNGTVTHIEDDQDDIDFDNEYQ